MEELSTWLRGWYDAEERVARKALGESLPQVAPAMSAGDAHIATYTPERVLLDLALKQRILVLHRQSRLGDGSLAGSCASCRGETWPCLTMRLLTLPYADRPGYRQQWRP